MSITTTTYFNIFKIKKINDINPKELKRRFRILVQKYHPDHGGTQEQFILIHNAFNYLKNRMKELIKQESPKFFNNKNFLFYGDGSIYSIRKKRWERLYRNGKKIIDNGKYIG